MLPAAKTFHQGFSADRKNSADTEREPFWRTESDQENRFPGRIYQLFS